MALTQILVALSEGVGEGLIGRVTAEHTALQCSLKLHEFLQQGVGFGSVVKPQLGMPTFHVRKPRFESWFCS